MRVTDHVFNFFPGVEKSSTAIDLGLDIRKKYHLTHFCAGLSILFSGLVTSGLASGFRVSELSPLPLSLGQKTGLHLIA